MFFYRDRVERYFAFVRVVLACVFVVMLGACQTTQFGHSNQGNGIATSREGAVSELEMLSLPQSIGIEYQDRVMRLDRLSREFGAPVPMIQENLQINAGAIPSIDYAVPIVRVVYQSQGFFDFNKDRLKASSSNILDVIAEQMKRDVPDVHLLVVGHTDSRGTDAYNLNLAERRALNVMRELSLRGVRDYQMSAVSIGEKQPIATNSTDEGRATNRRVEFLIGAFREANFMAVSSRIVNLEWINDHATLDTSVKAETLSSEVRVLGMDTTTETAKEAPVLLQRTLVLPEPRKLTLHLPPAS